MLVHVQLDGSERVVALTDLEEQIRAGTLGPETPVRADALTGGRWMPVGELELYKGLLSSPEAAMRRAWADPRIPWFTVVLVGVQLRIFLWTAWSRVEGPLVERWARSTPAILERDEYARLVTYGFFHGGLAHVAMNMIFIALIGAALERVVGSLSLAVLFFSSVFWGGVISGLLSPNAQAIGASAGDFGYLAAATVFGLRWFELLPPRARPRFGVAILVYLIYALLNGVLSNENIDNWGHVGGLVAGGLHMALLRPNVGEVWKARNLRVSFTMVLLAFAGLVGMARLPIPLVPITEDGLSASRPVWWTTGWAPTGESGWASPVGGGVLVARTTRSDAPVSTAASVSALLADYREVDPYAALLADVPLERDGVAGREVTLGYAHNGATRQVRAAVFTRGRYVHRVVLDAPVEDARVTRMAPRLFGEVRLPLPEDIAEARTAGDSWRGRLMQAEAEADFGNPDAARRLIEAARQEAPGEPAPAEALLDLAATYPREGIAATADDLLAVFPDDRGVRVAAANALAAAGDLPGALRRLDEGLARAPGDRKLTRARRALLEE